MDKATAIICLIAIVSLITVFVIFVQESYAITREEITLLKEDIQEVKNDITEIELEVKKFEDSVKNMELRVSNAVEREKTLKEIYDNNRNDSTREAWEEAQKDTIKEIRLLNEEKEKLEIAIEDRNLLNKRLLDLELKLENYERAFELESHLIDDGTKTIGIQLSQTCLRLISVNDTQCPTYENEVLQSLDNSDRTISGDFSYDDQGIYRRDKPQIRNHHLIYNVDGYEGYNILLDPDGHTTSKIKMIYLEINFDQYLTSSDHEKHGQNRTYHIDRHISKCKVATLNAEKYFEMLADTIFYMRNGCKAEFTKFDSLVEVQDHKTEFDIRNSTKYQYDKLIQEAKTKYKENRIGKD